MANRDGIAPSVSEFETIQEAYDFFSIDGVDFSASD